MDLFIYFVFFRDKEIYHIVDWFDNEADAILRVKELEDVKSCCIFDYRCINIGYLLNTYHQEEFL